HRHLVPGGHLVLDLFDPNLENLFGAHKEAFNREVRDQSSGHLVRRTVVARHVDAFNQVLTEQLRFERFNAAGDLIASGETSWSLRWTLRQEIAYLLELCGFEVIEQYSDFNGSRSGNGVNFAIALGRLSECFCHLAQPGRGKGATSG